MMYKIPNHAHSIMSAVAARAGSVHLIYSEAESWARREGPGHTHNSTTLIYHSSVQCCLLRLSSFQFAFHNAVIISLLSRCHNTVFIQWLPFQLSVCTVTLSQAVTPYTRIVHIYVRALLQYVSLGLHCHIDNPVFYSILVGS